MECEYNQKPFYFIGKTFRIGIKDEMTRTEKFYVLMQIYQFCNKQPTADDLAHFRQKLGLTEQLMKVSLRFT